MLNDKEKADIIQAISDNSEPGDESPCIIIARDYNYDEESYLRDMAEIHHIPLLNL